MKMRQLATIVVVTMMLAACSGADEEPTPEMQEDFIPVVSVTGEIVPAIWATLSAQTGGTVAEVLVEPGDEVTTGQLLVQLDSTDSELALMQAEAALEAAQAQLSLLEAGARSEEIAAAEGQLAAAQAAVSQAAAQRDQLGAGAVDAEVAAARAQVAAAEAEERTAREMHDQTIQCYELPDGTEACPALGTLEEQARYAAQAASEALTAARAQLDALLSGQPNQIRAAEAAVWAAAAQRDIAQAQLDLIQAGITDAELAVAEAAVAQAEAAAEAAKAALERCEVRAPFDGTLGVIYVRAAELVAPGHPLVAMGDLTNMRVETTDLDEIDVARVEVGQTVQVTFDAIPDQVFAGHLIRISPMADPGAGGVSYAAVIEVEGLDLAIRWGMTAFVDIEVER
jgi:multidrug efflux pump subunit AcrA (membrane-fusion protein)